MSACHPSPTDELSHICEQFTELAQSKNCSDTARRYPPLAVRHAEIIFELSRNHALTDADRLKYAELGRKCHASIQDFWQGPCRSTPAVQNAAKKAEKEIEKLSEKYPELFQQAPQNQ